MSSQKPKQGYKLVKILFGKYEEIPDDWNSEPISYFAEKDSGEWGIEYLDSIPEGYTQAKILRNTDFKKWSSEKGKFAPIRLIPKSKIDKITLATGDILIETSGGGPDQPLGRTIIVDAETVTQSKYPLVFSNFLARFRIKNIDSEFLYYFLQRYYQSKRMKNFEMQTTNLRNFDMKFFLKRFPVFFPELEQQEKITSTLSNVDYLIESYVKSIKSTKNLKNGLIQQLLTKGIGHKKFKKVTLGLRYMNKEIPIDWKISKIGNICKSIVSGRNKPKRFDGEIPWLTTADFVGFYVEKSKKDLKVSEIELKEKSGKTIPPNSVLISCVGDLGLVAINKIKVSMNQQLHAFVCPNEIEPYFLAQFLHTMKNYMNAIATVTTVPYMNKDNCESIVIVIPPINEQKKINSILSNIDNKIRDLESKKNNLERVKEGLMQKLLTGQIRVNL